jgi:phytoene synthase
MTATTLDEAYRVCENVTRVRARNFHYGIRLLPPAKRRSLCALYALSRLVDDVADGDLVVGDRAAHLVELRRTLRDIDGSTDPVFVALADTGRRFPVPLGVFEELIDGVEMDVTGRTFHTFDELTTYCRCVAGSVGRLCLGVFGSSDDRRAVRYADALGIALQQTNILRDVREDLSRGRVYLPQRELEAHGVTLTFDDRGALADPDGRLAVLIWECANRAREWYGQGARLMPLLDRRSAACASAMAGIYRRLLERIAARPQAAYDRRLALTGWQKVGVAARALMGGGGT